MQFGWQYQPQMLYTAGSVSLIFNYSTPRCVLTMHVSSAQLFFVTPTWNQEVFSQRGLPPVLSFSFSVLCWCKLLCIAFKFLSALDFLASLFSIASGLAVKRIAIVFLLLKLGGTDVSCFYFHSIIAKVLESKRGTEDSCMLETVRMTD